MRLQSFDTTTHLSTAAPIFELAAMKKPILLGVDGETRGIVTSYAAGEYFEPENGEDFLDKLNYHFA